MTPLTRRGAFLNFRATDEKRRGRYVIRFLQLLRFVQFFIDNKYVGCAAHTIHLPVITIFGHRDKLQPFVGIFSLQHGLYSQCTLVVQSNSEN